MKKFISQLKSISIPKISACILTFGLCGTSFAQQGALPINAAASVNGEIITNDMIEQGVKVAVSQGQKDSPDLRKAVLDRYVRVLLLSQQAEKNGLASTQKAKDQLAKIRQNYLADLELSSYLSQNPITEGNVRSEYDRQVAALGPKGMIMEYKISDIAVASEADALEALNRIKKGEAFDKVATSVSLSPNKAQGGSTGWVQSEQIPPELSSALANLNKGQVSTPTKLQQSWYLVKLEDKKSSKPASFEQAEQAVRASLIQKRQFELISKIAKESEIIIK